ncbi:L-lactate permease, partial [Escherichia coli]
AAPNTSDGLTGKMISPQSIALACAATCMVGRESELFRYTVKHSLIFASVIGIINLLQAYVFPGMLVS